MLENTLLENCRSITTVLVCFIIILTIPGSGTPLWRTAKSGRIIISMHYPYFNQVMFEYTSLENFWKRHNKVLLDKVALDKEKEVLMKENQQLRTLLKQYLDGISVNDEILSQVNPLFVVNHKTNVK